MRAEGFERVEEEAISLARQSSIEEDKEDEEEEDSHAKFLWSRKMLGCAESDEVEDMVSKVIVRKGEYKLSEEIVKAQRGK